MTWKNKFQIFWLLWQRPDLRKLANIAIKIWIEITNLRRTSLHFLIHYIFLRNLSNALLVIFKFIDSPFYLSKHFFHPTIPCLKSSNSIIRLLVEIGESQRVAVSLELWYTYLQTCRAEGIYAYDAISSLQTSSSPRILLSYKSKFRVS